MMESSSYLDCGSQAALHPHSMPETAINQALSSPQRPSDFRRMVGEKTRPEPGKVHLGRSNARSA